jgi:N-acylneuraminate cytidylyltransferase
MNAAIIPARGGSKRIPRKNIKPFCGKPMIAWSIEAARESGCFEHIVVSTDDDEIARVAQEYGAEVPFTRPANLADDYTATVPVIKHAIIECRKVGIDPEFVCCIYATAPFLDPSDLRSALARLRKSDAAYAFSVTGFDYPIQRSLRIDETDHVSMFHPEHYATRSQDLTPAYHDAGQFYWGKAAAWLDELPLFGNQSIAVNLPRDRVQDIDTPEDWSRAERMFEPKAITHVSESP